MTLDVSTVEQRRMLMSPIMLFYCIDILEEEIGIELNPTNIISTMPEEQSKEEFASKECLGNYETNLYCKCPVN